MHPRRRPQVSQRGAPPRLRGDERARSTVMRIVVAGATGAVGRQLLPRLVDGGHEGGGLGRRPETSEVVRSLGGRAVVSDVLDAEAVAAAVAAAEPEAIVHMATALAGGVDPRHFD